MNLYDLIIQDKEQVTLNDVFLETQNKEQFVSSLKNIPTLKNCKNTVFP